MGWKIEHFLIFIDYEALKLEKQIWIVKARRNCTEVTYILNQKTITF